MKLLVTEDHDHVIYLEIEDQGLLISDPPEMAHLAHRYAKIRSQALSPDGSLSLIEQLAESPGEEL